jgi:hypothetical protein
MGNSDDHYAFLDVSRALAGRVLAITCDLLSEVLIMQVQDVEEESVELMSLKQKLRNLQLQKRAALPCTRVAVHEKNGDGDWAEVNAGKQNRGHHRAVHTAMSSRQLKANANKFVQTTGEIQLRDGAEQKPRPSSNQGGFDLDKALVTDGAQLAQR